MTDKQTLQEILSNLAIDKNLKDPQIGYHGSGALFNRYNPSFGYTGEGAQVYGEGLYSGSVPAIGEHYKDMAERSGKQGYLYELGLPEQYKYYNTDLPSTQQNEWIKARLGNVAKPDTGRKLINNMEYQNALMRSSKFNNVYDDFTRLMGYAPKYTNEIVDFINNHPDLYPEPLYEPLTNQSQAEYEKLGKILREKGIVGTTHAGANGAHINITFNPDDIIVTGPNGATMPQVADATQTNLDYLRMQDAYRRAFTKPTFREGFNKFLNTPLMKSLGRAGSTALKGIGAAGDLYMLTEAAKQSDNRLIHNDNPMSGLDFNNIQFEGAKELPLIQVNNDGSPNVTLQGQVSYDEYLLEPNDNIWVRPIPSNTRF